jgi:hypothetical protein
MPCTISGKLTYLDSAGAAQPLSGKKLYLVPSRTDFTFTPDGGTTWLPWQKNEDLPTAYQNGVEATTNGTGAWSFVVPFTDTEIALPGGAPSPSLFWNIIDANTGKVYYGPTPSATVSTAKTLKELLALGSPNTWQIAGSTQIALPTGRAYKYSGNFTDASDELPIAFATPASTTDYEVLPGIETDDTTGKQVYSVNVKQGSRTVNGFTLKLSQTPPSGKTVKAWARVELP